MESVVHFEMPCDDRGRVAKFYSEAFGWKMQKLGEEMGDYVIATTGESDENGRPKEPGVTNGGFYPRTADAPHPSVVIAVADIVKAMATVTKAGGTILGEPQSIPGIGQFVSFLDTEGNRASMLQGG